MSKNQHFQILAIYIKHFGYIYIYIYVASQLRKKGWKFCCMDIDQLQHLLFYSIVSSRMMQYEQTELRSWDCLLACLLLEFQLLHDHVQECSFSSYSSSSSSSSRMRIRICIIIIIIYQTYVLHAASSRHQLRGSTTCERRLHAYACSVT